MGKKLSFEDVKALYENGNREIVEMERREVGKLRKQRVYIKYKCLIDDFIGWDSLYDISRGKICELCFENGRFIKIKERLREISPSIEILSDNYVNSKTKLKCKCLIDNHIWYQKWGHLSQGHGCPVCSGRVVHDGNRLSLIRPDLIKYFVNPEDADEYTIKSDRKVQLVCPDCGMKKINLISVKDLSVQGFSCSYCSDKLTLPEKFGINLFKQLGIEFKTQKIFNWAKDKRYDFCFKLGDDIHICEVHGIQHYEKSRRGRSLESEKNNDKLKYNLAIQNGIKSENYTVVDCRYSNFEYMVNNYTKQLSIYFNLSNIDWLKIWEDCQASLVIEVCDAWNNKKEHETTTSIGDIFGLTRGAISRYLKRCTQLGLCSYDPKEENKKSGKRVSCGNSKTTYQYSLDNKFIKKWNSNAEVEKELGIHNVNISECCLGKKTSAGGFKWSYVKLDLNIKE